MPRPTPCEKLRAPESGVSQTYGVKLGVTGITAIIIDVSDKLAGVFPLYVAIILGVSLVVLLLVFRSIAVPHQGHFRIPSHHPRHLRPHHCRIPVGMAEGGLWLRYRRTVGQLHPHHDHGDPFGLAMDYEVFLVSSMRESHVHGTAARRRHRRLRPKQPRRRGGGGDHDIDLFGVHLLTTS